MDNTYSSIPPGDINNETSLEDTFPPKPELEEKKQNVWVKSLVSLSLYLAFGYFFFKQWDILLILTAIVIFHELGHFFAMKYFNYTELGIFFVPLLGAYATGTKHEVSQKQSAIILLAGPLPGIIIGIVLYFVNKQLHSPLIEITSNLLIFLNLLNLLPVYPLDGGQLLNRLFMDEYNIVGKIFVIISAALMIWFSWHFIYPTSPIVAILLLYFPVNVLLRLKNEIDNDKLLQKIESEGVNLTTTYAEITDEEYWKTRNAIIKHHPSLNDIPAAPPYEYARKEDKVITTMQSLLQRLIIMDIGLSGKIFIILLWAACFAAPFLLNIPLNFFQAR